MNKEEWLPTDRLYTPKEAGLLKSKVYWVECPVCDTFGATLTKKIYCSEECSSKMKKASKWMAENHYAMNGDTVMDDNKLATVFQTTALPINIAKGLDKFIYILQVKEEFIRVENLNFGSVASVFQILK